MDPFDNVLAIMNDPIVDDSIMNNSAVIAIQHFAAYSATDALAATTRSAVDVTAFESAAWAD